ncbi:STAS domain-containing protein [Candidatus Methylobacter oryzae]|uniref:STAS domain-containing protein n=1 Tax=Candidatus Methylobacter oryzae TaxID=2497749 RepID=A0ABY3C9K2_9GAMM|nr:STAS domain-containing protein [Candidatus Methylobacter oryzae]TRW94346.1 STAS domain-containing protein [Candidatus Methylobacter oryzae]
MATSEENSLIGYDPLAWMDDDTEKNEDHFLADDLADNIDEIVSPNISEEDELGTIEAENSGYDGLVEEASPSIDSHDIEEEADDEGWASEEESSQIDLDATLSIQNVVKLHEKLKNLLAVHDEIEINASDVSSIDTATLQLLVSLKKDSVKLQKKVTIIYPSPRFVESTRLLGLLDVLEVQDM